MNYFRRIEKPISELKYKMQLGALLLNINNNKNNIKSLDNNLEKINTNISSNLRKIDTIEKDILTVLPTLKIFEKKYNIENQSFNFDRNTSFFNIFEIEIKNKFSKFGMLNIKSNIYYKYDDLRHNMYRTAHKYQFYDDKDTLFYEIVLNKYNFGATDFDNNIFHIKDTFYVKIKDDYNKIKIVILLARMYPSGSVQYKLKHINDNFVNIIYLDKNDISLKIKTNEKNIKNNNSNIASNLINMNINEDNIAINTDEINNIKKIKHI